jgi:DNA-binding GntR family transcriptional regulator
MTHHVREALRAELLSGRLESGERLPVAALAARFEVSGAVVREALTALAAEGLLESQSQVGFRVVNLSVDHLRDLTAVRCQIDSMALRGAIMHGDIAWEAGVVAAHHMLISIPIHEPESQSLADEWSDAHRNFHSKLVEGCGSPVLLDIRSRLWDASEMYRRPSLLADDERDVIHEHRSLLEATLSRDAEAAVQLMISHVTRATEVLILALSGAADKPDLGPTGAS